MFRKKKLAALENNVKNDLSAMFGLGEELNKL